MLNALLIPVVGPLEVIGLDETLERLQGIVGGNIQALPLPAFIDGAHRATAYINEEGKFDPDAEAEHARDRLPRPGRGPDVE